MTQEENYLIALAIYILAMLIWWIVFKYAKAVHHKIKQQNEQQEKTIN